MKNFWIVQSRPLKRYVVSVLLTIPIVTGIVASGNETAAPICKWTFDSASIIVENSAIKVTDKTGGYTGTIRNEARIRTLGDNEFNVLYLENDDGYFDMGADIGEAVYGLSNYTVMCYFRVDGDYSELSREGNYLYAFSNTPRASLLKTGYIAGKLKDLSHICTPTNWEETQVEVNYGSEPGKGSWHHFAYVQEGDIGKVYIDGDLKKLGMMKHKPSTAVAIDGKTGTLVNWIGRSIGDLSDVYLRKTMVYDFNLYGESLTSGAQALNEIMAVADTIHLLNQAYETNPDYKPAELMAEFNNLNPGDVSNLKENITLPLSGSITPEIEIKWNSSKPAALSAQGVISRPDYFDAEVTLTATLTYGVYSIEKTFNAIVAATDETAFESNLVAHFDFSNPDGSTVTDLAEKQYSGTLKNSAKIVTMGLDQTGIYNVLSLGSGNGYFDMGTEIGKPIVHLNDYTVSAYFRIDENYTNLGSNGNFLWNFSNSADANSAQNGYMIGSLRNQSHSITPKYYTAASGNQRVSFEREALKGNWHHMMYTQKGNQGILYIDGTAVASNTITNTPANSLAKSGLAGTMYNWIGRSCYTSDVYLQNTLIYDFRLYNGALNENEINSNLDVKATIASLERAYESYLGDSKTAETQIPDLSGEPKPAFMEIILKDSSKDQFSLIQVNAITMNEGSIGIMNYDESLGNYSVDNIQKIVFGGDATPTPKVIQDSHLLIYPNPASDFILVHQADNNAASIKIFSMMGELMHTENPKSKEVKIDISHLSKGMYIVKVNDRMAKFVKK